MLHFTQGQIWFNEALKLAHQGDRVRAKKAYAIALRYDPTLPPLPKFRNHKILRALEHACLIVIIILLGLIIYLLCAKPTFHVKTDFPWWIVKEQGGKVLSVNDVVMQTAEVAFSHDLTTGKIIINHPLELLRTALYLFIVDQGYFPQDLYQLVTYKYLETIPPDLATSLNVFTPNFTGTGGWVYSPPTNCSNLKLEEEIAKALFPNYDTSLQDEFKPLTLEVDLGVEKITLLKGEMPLKSWPVSIGSPNSPTPAGSWRIVAKNVLSQSKTNPYGSRWLRLGQDYPFLSKTKSKDPLALRGIGIHGTNNPSELGKAITDGCVRMLNRDIEELYEMIPNGAMLTIVGQ